MALHREAVWKMTFLVSAVWIYSGIESPLLVVCFYGLMDRFRFLTSKYVVMPSVAMVCGYFFLNGAVAQPFYSHFAIAAAFILSCYLLCNRFGYASPQSLSLALLTLIAVDELWQTPFNSLNWTYSLSSFEIGIATAGWNLMSLPLIGASLIRFRFAPKLSTVGKKWLLVCAALTIFEIWRFYIGGYPDNSSPAGYPGFEPYYLVFPWFIFFILLFRSSAKTGVSDGTAERY